MEEAEDLIRRAGIALAAARFAPLARVTSLEYRRIAERTATAMTAAGDTWTGIGSLGGAPSTQASRRAAWSRGRTKKWRPHWTGCVSVSSPSPRGWTCCGSGCRKQSQPRRAPSTVPAPGAGARRPLTRSKRHSLRSLPEDWLDQVWAAACAGENRHRDEIAILLVTGCRPSEAAWGVDVVAAGGDVVVAIAGAKLTEDHGQPWRRLRVTAAAGPAAYLRDLAHRAGGVAHLRPSCSPAALSMAVADLGAACHLPGRISAYSIRHQRASDARAAFGGDLDRLAAWLGHFGREHRPTLRPPATLGGVLGRAARRCRSAQGDPASHTVTDTRSQPGSVSAAAGSLSRLSCWSHSNHVVRPVTAQAVGIMRDGPSPLSDRQKGMLVAAFSGEGLALLGADIFITVAAPCIYLHAMLAAAAALVSAWDAPCLPLLTPATVALVGCWPCRCSGAAPCTTLPTASPPSLLPTAATESTRHAVAASRCGNLIRRGTAP